MKTILSIVFFAFSISLPAQIGVGFGTDVKILLFGTDNQYTEHDATFNYNIKVELIDGRNTYWAVGHKYVNLSNKYYTFYFNVGETIKLNDKWTLIPQLEGGMLFRRTITYNHGILYPQGNIAMRYNITKWLSVEGRGYLQLARDLQHRTFRYGGELAIVIY